MYQKTDYFHTQEFRKLTQCPITGQEYSKCPYTLKRGIHKSCCGFRTNGVSPEEQLTQIKTHISSCQNCSTLYLRSKVGKMFRSEPRTYTNWVLQYYQPTNTHQSPVNLEWVKPKNEQQRESVTRLIPQDFTLQIPHNKQEVVARLIWERRGKPEGKTDENWEMAAKMLRKYWFWNRHRQAEDELKHYGPVYTKLNLVVTAAVRELNPNYQQRKHAMLRESYDFYQKQLQRIQREL
jgi:hypothetical protein